MSRDASPTLAAPVPAAGATASAEMEDLSFLDARRRALVEENLDLVGRVASRWRRRCWTRVEYRDLLQAGALGLIDAAGRFDSARSDSFPAFARERIRGAICDHLRQMDPLPRRRRQAVKQLQDAMAAIGSRRGAQASVEETAEHLGWTNDEVLDAKADLERLSLGMTFGAELDEDHALPTPGSVGPEEDACDALLRSELRQKLAAEIERLPRRHALVLSLYYHDELTMKEIGEVLGITESRVSQVHSAAVAALRARLRSSGAWP